MNMDDGELRFLAVQLSCPQGTAGIEVANKMNMLNLFMTEKALEMLAPKSGEVIAEIGPGNGALSQSLLAALGPRGRYLGIEMSETMADEARQRLSGMDCATDIICGNCLEIDLEAGSIDGVMAINVLYFVDDLAPFLARLFGWLKPGGRIVFGVRSDHVLKSYPFTQYGFNIRSIDEIRTAMTVSGFVAVGSIAYDEGEAPFGDAMLSVDSVIIIGYKPT